MERWLGSTTFMQESPTRRLATSSHGLWDCVIPCRKHEGQSSRIWLQHGLQKALDVRHLNSFFPGVAPRVAPGGETGTSEDYLSRCIFDPCCDTIQQSQLHGILFLQVITAELMQHWEKKQELEVHVRDIQGQYARRASIMLQAADTHLRGLAEWVVPRAGMFLWARLLHCTDADEVVQELLDAGVVVLPGELLLA